MPVSEAAMILVRLSEHSADGWDGREKETSFKAFRLHSASSLVFGEEVLSKRTRARKSSADLLDHIVRQSESKKTSAVPNPQHHHSQTRKLEGLWVWLERLEREMLEEKTFLDLNLEDYVHDLAEKEERLAAWKAELDLRQTQALKALKLALASKADKHARNVELWEDCIKRISAISFPRELLVAVAEAAVASQILHLRLNQSISLAEVGQRAFRKWPEHLKSDVRSFLLQLAARAILEHSVIVIRAVFISSGTQFTVKTPPAIQGSEVNIRFLALDLCTVSRDAVPNPELGKAIHSMASLKPLFSNLDSFTLTIHFVHDTQYGRSHLTTDRPGLPCSVKGTLSFRNLVAFATFITLETTIVGLFDTLLDFGPGKRKFIRFAHSEAHRPYRRLIGPLVRVSCHRLFTSLRAAEKLATEEDHSAADAERIFQQAYWGPLGPTGEVWTSFREQ